MTAREKCSLEELGERSRVGGEVVYLGGQAGSRKKRGRALQASLK